MAPIDWPADTSLLAVVLLLTVMVVMEVMVVSRRKGPPQVGTSVAWHGNIGITCYNGNWRNNSFLKTGASYYSNELSALAIIWILLEDASQISLLFSVVDSPSQLISLFGLRLVVPSIGGHIQSVNNHWKSVIVIGCGD